MVPAECIMGPGARFASSGAMDCLDVEAILAFVGGGLPPDRIAKLEAHVSRRAACHEQVSIALAATSASVPSPRPRAFPRARRTPP